MGKRRETPDLAERRVLTMFAEHVDAIKRCWNKDWLSRADAVSGGFVLTRTGRRALARAHAATAAAPPAAPEEVEPREDGLRPALFDARYANRVVPSGEPVYVLFKDYGFSERTEPLAVTTSADAAAGWMAGNDEQKALCLPMGVLPGEKLPPRERSTDV